MTMDESRCLRLSRRQLLGLLSAGAGFGFFSAGGSSDPLLAAPWQAAPGAKPVIFPNGAIIRTILKDLSPAALSGSIFFHEHLDGVYSRDSRPLKLPLPSTAGITPVVADV